ncbi:MAG: AAA family ATPase [Candidatus Thermoplasmatota archaeon]|nr:AAA family ATPase [Candidatus Thermoplasmatota archaeon]
MNPTTLLGHLKNPALYGPDVDNVTILQTHISFVALTGQYAYKIKKPVDFGFLDFSSLGKRKHFCEQELQLNKRLCPDIYLDVVPLTKKNESLELNGKGPVVEYAVKMKEFAQENIMTTLLQRRAIDKQTIETLCTLLVDFYKKNPSTDEIRSYGTVDVVKRNIDENFEQTASVIGTTIPKETYAYLKQANAQFFQQNKEVFAQRIASGKIQDCHGDLHSGNIVVDDNICIFDCIEFNKRFRYCDVASDISFLAMDLDYQNHPYLSSYLIHTYIEKSDDTGIFTVLNFYKSYRAYVRGKVIGFRLDDPTINDAEKQEIIATTNNYYALSRYYASLFMLTLTNKKPLLFMVSGLTGTGKSTLSLKVAVDYHAHLLNTDIVRKELAGIDKYQKHHDPVNTGLYAPGKVAQTYEKILENTAALLDQGHNVVLDATFQKKEYRTLAQKVAADHNAHFIALHCTAPDHVVKQWLEERLKEKTVSDGRWEIYVAQKDSYEPLGTDEPHIEIDMSNQNYDCRMKQFETILRSIVEG